MPSLLAVYFPKGRTCSLPCRIGLLGSAAVVVSALALRSFPVPLAWICLAWATVWAFAASCTSSDTLKTLCISACAALLTIGGFELFLVYQSDDDSQVRDVAVRLDGTAEIRSPHPVLGYAPGKDITVRWQRFYEDRLLFDIDYKIDRYGLRVAPPATKGDTSQCVVFLGGSFTFGPGVNDHETMPYLVGLGAANARVYNFGYSGYGPHQALAALDFGLIDEIVRCRPTHFVYQAIDDHARRVAGKASWDWTGPRYTKSEDGSVRYAGTFRDGIGELWVQMRKSAVLRSVWLRENLVTPEDVDLMVAVVATIDNVVAERWPGSEFHVIYWDRDAGVGEMIIAGLEARDINLHRVSEFLPGYARDSLRYELDVYDQHPNRLAHELVAAYVLDTLLAPAR